MSLFRFFLQLRGNCRRHSANQLRPTGNQLKLFRSDCFLLQLINEISAMKTFLFTLVACLATGVLFGQPDTAAYGHFYATYQDYLDGRALPGVKQIHIDRTRVEIDNNGQQSRVKISQLPAPFFVSTGGTLMRVYDKELYYVVVEGPLCYCFRNNPAIAGYNAETGGISVGRYSQDDGLGKEYYSETASGDIKRLTRGVMNQYLAQYGLTGTYKSDKVTREFKDSVDEYKSKQCTKTAKYIVLINEKMTK
jgi:hypothetical protein